MNFCFVIDKSVYKSLKSNFNEVISFLRRSNPQLDIVLQQADFIETVCAAGYIPYGFLRPPSNHENVYFLGDQRMVIPSFTGDGMAIALSTARNCAYEFNSHQKGCKVQVGPMQGMLEKQMRWAFMGHAILKYPLLMDMCGCFSGLSHFLIETIFRKTRVSLMGEREDEHQFLENNYSRC